MQPILRSRVLPRVSFRAVMALTLLAAVLAMTARAAGDGGTLAKATLVTVLVLAAFFVLAAASFLIAWVTALLVHGKAHDALQGNPFKADQLPPQQIKPREPVL